MNRRLANKLFIFCLLFVFTSSLSYAKKVDSEYHLLNYNEAVKLYKAGELEKSVFYFNNTVSLAPYDLPSHLKLGELFLKLSKEDLAISSLTHAATLAPDDALIELLLGKAYEQERKMNEAISHYKQALKLEPDNVLIKVNLGLACILTNDFKCAVDHLAKVAITYPNHLKTRLALGIAYHSLKEYYLAKEEYEFILGYIPNNDLLWYNLAKTQIALGEFTDALDSLTNAISNKNSEVDFYLDRAFVHYKLNNLEEADRDYKTSIRIDPQNPVTYVEYGFFLWHTGAYLKAIEEFDKALLFESDGKELLSYKAYLYQILNQEDNAISMWQEVLNKDGLNTTALFNLARLHQNKGDYEIAAGFYRKLVDLEKSKNKEDIEAKLGLAYSLQKSDDLEGARLGYQNLLKKYPNDPVILFNYGVLNIDLKDYTQGTAYFEKAIQNNFSPLKLVYEYLVEAHYQTNDIQKLKSVYEKWLDLDKGNVQTRISYARLLAKIGDMQKAIEQFRVAATLDNTNKSRFKLAQFLLEQKDFYGALGQLQEYLKVEPSDLDALIILANLYKDLGIKEQSINTYKKILTLQSDNHLAYYNLGLLYQENKSFDEAQNYLLKAIELNDSYAPSYYALGLSYISQNQKEKAKELFQKYLQLDPNGEYKEKAEERLKELLAKPTSQEQGPA